MLLFTIWRTRSLYCIGLPAFDSGSSWPDQNFTDAPKLLLREGPS